MFRALVFVALMAASAVAGAGNFPRPASLEPAVQFWIKVYTQVSTNQGYVHDAQNLSVIYETVDLPEYASAAERERLQKNAKFRVADALTAVARGKRDHLSKTEARVLAAWPDGTSSRQLFRAAENVRFQLGQSNRFREGLVRSGQWKPHIRQVLAAYGLPQELEVLPHVESSFNPGAWSKVAAAGMWQFMPATARQYMRVDHVVDERMDPFAATVGAARLLKRNHEITGTWPLALTSYNHGVGGMVKAAQRLGTRDIGVIVQKYNGPSFGFASRNFYASFLAALEIDHRPKRYFGDLRLDSPTDYEVFTVSDFIPASALLRSTGVSAEVLKQHNPALLEPVWTGEKYIPEGYTLRIPRAELDRSLQNHVAAIPAGMRFAHQKPDLTHRIAQGESLWVIARRYDTTVAKLMALNGLGSKSVIRAGRTLILPGTVQAEPVPAAGRAAPVAATESIYVIRKGDSLWSIARRFNVSQQQLVAWNGISEKRYLQPGQKLKVKRTGADRQG